MQPSAGPARWPGRWTLTAGVALVALAVLSFSAYANFTGAASTSHTASTGTLTITLANPALGTPMSTSATGLAPGDIIERVVNLTTGGTVSMTAVTLTTTASPSSLLDTDATNGLQLVVDVCNVAWTTTANPYTCGGVQSPVIASRAVIGAGIAMSNLSLSGLNYLRVKLTLPTTAGDTFQNLVPGSTISFSFSGTQRAATYK